jgi:decaprenyl-phosphate phosphoribosyltransferase
VLAGLLFGRLWHQADLVQLALLSVAAFCLASSAVYVLNDWLDRQADALHPRKRHRPLASGALSGTEGAMLGLACLAGAVWLAALTTPIFMGLLTTYLLLNTAYTLRLKQVPVVDVFIIAAGFMLRLLAGTWAIGIQPSHWLLLTGLFVTLFLGFAKRRAESFHASEQQRAVLAHYPPAFLDLCVGVTLTATLLTYSLFATSPEALERHGPRLWMTIPLVVFGALRYVYQVHRGQAEDFARDLLRDRWIVLSAVGWLLVFASPRA